MNNIEIYECGEEVVFLNGNDFFLEPIYFKWKFSDTNVMKLRSGVIEKLKNAKEILQNLPGRSGWNFKIWDGYRPLSTQKKLYDNYFNILKEKYPLLEDKRLHEATGIFVFPPSYDPTNPSPHNTGGAIDLTLVDENSVEIPMGTQFDEFNVRSFTDHFKESNDSIDPNAVCADLPKGKASLYPENECRAFHKNRMLLKKVLEEAGFVNYHEEWWHFSYGDAAWAKQKQAPYAIYGSGEL